MPCETSVRCEAVEFDCTLVCPPQTSDQFEHGGLAGTRWPKQSCNLFVEREIEFQSEPLEAEGDVRELEIHAGGVLRLKSHSLIQTATNARTTETVSNRNASPS